jgi:hypothetical protein
MEVRSCSLMGYTPLLSRGVTRPALPLEMMGVRPLVV